MKPWRLCSIDEALRRALEDVQPLETEARAVDLSPGHVLAEAVAADRDQPPLDVSAMDGYAVRSQEAIAGAVLQVQGAAAAGSAPGGELRAAGAMRIMTGAPLPAGTDAVVRFERTETLSDGRVRVLRAVRSGDDLRAGGSERRRGEVLLRPGQVLGAAELGVLASVGCRSVEVHPQPLVAVAATGNELVSEAPRDWQQRNSNGPMMEALARQCGARVLSLGVLEDRDERLDEGLRLAVREADLLVLSGGVSRGDWDLVPGAFCRAALRTLVHGVSLKPGKPVLIASPEGRGSRLCRAFGLPGNPLSTLVTFLLFVWPVIRRLAGRAAVPLRVRARTLEEIDVRTSRTELRPVSLTAAPGGWHARLSSPRGSADLAAAAGAAGFAILGAGPRRLSAGEPVEVLSMPDVLERVSAKTPASG